MQVISSSLGFLVLFLAVDESALAYPLVEETVQPIPITRRMDSQSLNMTRRQLDTKSKNHMLFKYSLYNQDNQDDIDDGAALAKRSPITLDNRNNLLYTAQVTLGNGQEFNLNFDTGSSDTWFRGLNCKSQDASCQLGYAVNPKDTSVRPLNRPFQVRYGSGVVSGQVHSSTVNIGPTNLNLASIPIGVATKLAGFTDGATDGLLGLAYNSISQISRATDGSSANYMDALAKESGRPNMVSFYLSNDAARSGSVVFGAMDTTKFTGPMTFVKVNSASYWQFNFAGARFSVAGVQGDAAGGIANAIADTGTTLMIMATPVAKAINAALGATSYSRGVYNFADCKRAKAGAPLILTMNGQQYSIPASIYALVGTDGTCYSGITGGAESQVILGDSFLRAYYSVFDKENGQIGFAKSIENTV